MQGASSVAAVYARAFAQSLVACACSCVSHPKRPVCSFDAGLFGGPFRGGKSSARDGGASGVLQR